MKWWGQYRRNFQVYDYFVTDHQQNVRMILSEEVQYASNTATMESSRAAQEEPVFGRSGAGNELAASRYATPSGWQNASVGAQVSRLGSLSGNMVGPNTLQKVMAGDQMSATVQYFFESAPGNSTPLTTMLLNTLGQLLSTGSQVGGLVKGNATAVTSQLGGNPGFVNAVNPAQGGTNTPQAYLTMVFFDERFEPIAEADGGVVRQQVAQSVGSGGSTLGLGNIKAPRNGYVLVYVSNSSEQPVYFDNLQVGKVNGNILEENHYYSFGLRISAISSRRFTDQYQGKVPNAYLYNGKELMDEDADLGWLEYGFRFYDPQIGRFQQIDPMADELSSYSPYHYAYNDPVGLIDFMGLAGIDPYSLTQLVNNAKSAALAAYKPLQEIIITGVIKKASNINKGIALLKVGGGLLEMAAGATIGVVAGWTGVGAVIGAAGVFHGADQVTAGVMELMSGKSTHSFTEQGIQSGLEIAGVSKENAEMIAPYADAGISIALTGGAGSSTSLPLARSSITKGSEEAANVISNSPKLLPPKFYRFPNALEKFAKHAKEWTSIGGVEAYYKRALDLANSSIGGDILGFTSRDGWMFRMNAKTGEFLTMKPNGEIETFFRRLSDASKYWAEQIAKYGQQ